MNAQKFTQKSLEAIREAQNLTVEHQNMQLEQEHLLAALLTQEQGLVPELLLKMGIPAEQVEADALRAVDGLPKVTGSGREAGKIYVSEDVDKTLTAAEREGREHEGRICLGRAPFPLPDRAGGRHAGPAVPAIRH